MVSDDGKYKRTADVISPVLFADDGRRASSVSSNVLAAPRLDEVVVMLATELFLQSLVSADASARPLLGAMFVRRCSCT